MSQPNDPVVSRLRAVGCVFAEDEAALLRSESADSADLERRLARRERGEPLEYILGWAEFGGLRIGVGDGVFVPRQRTTVLARAAINLLTSIRRPRPVVLDLCCGTGAIAAVIAAAHVDATIYAADIDPDAVALARRNLPGRTVYLSDLFAAIPDRLRGTVDILTANAPYVPTAAIALMPPEARDHEHRVALDGGTDGLELHRRVIDRAADWLAPGGHLLLESSEDQASITAALMDGAGFRAQIVHEDEVDGTAIVGTAPE